MKTIRLIYRKLIDASNTKPWDQMLFEGSWYEYLLQAQTFNPEKKYNTFAELIANVPNADRIHFLVTPAIIGYLKQLNGRVPDITNNIGKTFLPFKIFKFEIVNSDITDKKKHQVAVNFISEPLTWHNTISNQLLVTINNEPENGETLTEMFSMQPFLSIYSIQS
ncbi:hypothetical protein [[Flexibacter] sp. ATCC 35208]|uniref:hypothetical protein n=1 Tax=[Flexibacter] sp. ATCC 35208 TaxID=1936242 RepID=UPI0009D21D02|nr:hypothetical protein [[Flexibacter] sp. ATCC 35208]OMP79143.1 hypothetical protein BW716_11020 [[Flexibacter] sp. ATCC 35208]